VIASLNARRRARVAVDERDLRAGLHDDEGVREDGGPLVVEVREGLDRELDRGVPRDVKERAAGSERGMERREFRPIRGHESVEVGLDQLRARRGGLVEAAEPDVPIVEGSAPLGREDGAVPLDLEAGPLAGDARGAEEPVWVDVLRPPAIGERLEVELEVGEVGVAPLLRLLGRDGHRLEQLQASPALRRS
jgi:hypothetical protein